MRGKNRALTGIFLLLAALFAAFLAAPVIRLLFKSFWGEEGFTGEFYTSVFSTSHFGRVLGNSFAVSAAAALLAVVIAFVLAYAIHYTKIPRGLKGFLRGGVPARYARYDGNQRLLAENLRVLGFRPYLDPGVQGPVITTFRYPDGCRFTFRQMYDYIKERGYVLYLGKVMEAETFRVGNIGEIYPEDIVKFSAILADFLQEVAAA